MNKKAYTKQHYIPQSYLRNFANSKKSIYTYDKIESRVYNAAIDNICCIDDFYRISDFSLNEKEQLAIECDYFAQNIEPQYKSLIEWFINQKDECLNCKKAKIELSIADKKNIAKYILIQYFRLPDMRKRISGMVDDFMLQTIPILKELIARKKNNPNINTLDIGYKFDPVSTHAALSFLDGELMDEFTTAFAKNYWSFLVSKDGRFYTSDYPLAVFSHVPNVEPMYLGLAQYGGELTFPISRDIIIAIWDNQFFSNRRKDDCNLTIIDSEEEKRQNLLRYIYAKRYVFCHNNDFEQIGTFKNY